MTVPAVHQLLDRAGPVLGEMQPAAGLQVGQRLVGVALADRPADFPVGGIALPNDGGELGVAADRLVDEAGPAAGADRLGLLGIPQGADTGRAGGLEEGGHAVGIHHGCLLH